MAKVFLGMSGGVDSTAAAVLLKRQGHEVTGITLKLWDDASRCCDYDDVMDAKRACWNLGIRHYVLNLKPAFKRKVVDYFTSEYLSGRTPNPCVVCNEEIKFAALLKKMREHGYDYVATGHYAIIDKKGGSCALKMARDRKKSQEYFLARLKKENLGNILFPLGALTKAKARALVQDAGLRHDKPESQEVCFLQEGESPYEFIERQGLSKGRTGGTLCLCDGSIIGRLDKAYFKYTIGQRKGLGTGGGKEPLYVAAIDPEEKKVIAGPKQSVMRDSFEAGSLNMLENVRSKSFRAEVKIRYQSRPAKCRVLISGSMAKVELTEQQFAVTPGQLAVFYKGRTVLGSGFII